MTKEKASADAIQRTQPTSWVIVCQEHARARHGMPIKPKEVNITV